MFHVEANILFHGNITECNTTITKNTWKRKSETPEWTWPTPMHYKLLFLCMTHSCPYDRQSSCSSFNVTETSYIWVIQNPHLCGELASPDEGHTSCPSFHNYFRFLHNTSGLPKTLCWLHLTPLVTLASWEASYE